MRMCTRMKRIQLRTNITQHIYRQHSHYFRISIYFFRNNYEYFPFCYVIVITIQGKENQFSATNIRVSRAFIAKCRRTRKKMAKMSQITQMRVQTQTNEQYSSHFTFNYNTNHLPCVCFSFCSSCIDLKYDVCDII